MKKNQFILLALFLLVQCKTKLDLGDETSLPVLSTLFNNRMLLLLKGTYSTDSPLEWSELNNGTGALYVDSQVEGNDPAMSLTNLPTVGGLPIFIDIGEVRISSKYTKGINDLTQIRDSLDSTKFWDFIGNERQVYCTVSYSFDENTCVQNNGIAKAVDFFNGVGAQYPSNDPSAKTESAGYGLSTFGRQYYYSGIYFRSLVTGFANDAGVPITTTRFDNKPVIGLNIVPRNNYNPGTSSISKSSIVPKMFPVLYSQKPTQADMEIREGFDPYILEVRVNLKENLMLHSYLSARAQVITYVGISDIFNDHKGEGDAGGNFLSRARVIYPETASSLSITGGTGSLLHHYAVFRAAETDLTTVLPLAATPAKAGAKIKYLNPGLYTLACMGDITRVDGFPETVISQTTFAIPEYPFRQTYSVDLSCP
ncbi:hypothetical protein EHQ58_09585 [Leptospira ognonensis]|uniref:Uncharacterized protein n=1 Tax=Leptospira ognonensis TaxID=2484945 RepID=A0A4R9K0G9_9LEPT|nr:hypothetical protein [Leptospira ognonensis]TGL59152.1 hypothetical protein EHQ58_09585 [Leptospira ognonensis]